MLRVEIKQPLTVAYHRLSYVAVRYCKTITTSLHSPEAHLKFQKGIYSTNYKRIVRLARST
jgi:hypothetical protein